MEFSSFIKRLSKEERIATYNTKKEWELRTSFHMDPYSRAVVNSRAIRDLQVPVSLFGLCYWFLLRLALLSLYVLISIHNHKTDHLPYRDGPILNQMFAKCEDNFSGHPKGKQKFIWQQKQPQEQPGAALGKKDNHINQQPLRPIPLRPTDEMHNIKAQYQ